MLSDERKKILEKRKIKKQFQPGLEEIIQVERNKALKRLIYETELQKLKTYLTAKEEHYLEEEMDDKTRIYVDYARGNRAIINKLQKRGDTNLYLWITISPPPMECSIEEQIKKYQNYFRRMESKATVAGGYYTFEFGGSQEHLHVHFFLKQVEEKAYANGKVYEKHGDTCMCKDVALFDKKTKIAFDVQPVKMTSKSFDYLRRYIQGDKDDDDKMSSVETDIQLREKYGLEPYYKFGEEFWNDF